jgi:hypothetical protein
MSDSGDKEKMEEEGYNNEDYLSAYAVLGKENEPCSEPEEEKEEVEMVEVDVEEDGEEEEEAEMVEDKAEEIENDGAQEDDEEEEREPYGVEVEDDDDMDILKGIQRDPFSYADRQYMPPGGSCEKEVPWPPGRRPRARGGWRARLVAKGWVPKNDTRPYWTVPFHHPWKPINS